MAVDSRWGAVSCPSGMCNTAMRIKNLGEIWFLFRNELLQLLDLANLLECEDLVLLVTIHCQTCGIVPTVFEAREAIDQGLEDVRPVFLN